MSLSFHYLAWWTVSRRVSVPDAVLTRVPGGCGAGQCTQVCQTVRPLLPVLPNSETSPSRFAKNSGFTSVLPKKQWIYLRFAKQWCIALLLAKQWCIALLLAKTVRNLHFSAKR